VRFPGLAARNLAVLGRLDLELGQHVDDLAAIGKRPGHRVARTWPYTAERLMVPRRCGRKRAPSARTSRSMC
jgi:hypothetical protein